MWTGYEHIDYIIFFFEIKTDKIKGIRLHAGERAKHRLHVRKYSFSHGPSIYGRN